MAQHILATKIKTSQNEFKKYLSKPIPSSMVCDTVTRSENINIVHAFSDSKSPGCVPDSLKIAKVIPIFKKGDTANPSNYRPISLRSIFHKLLEKLMYMRVYSFLHNFSVLYQYQFGFRQHHSTSLALVELCDSLYSHLELLACVLTSKKPLIQLTTKFYLKNCIIL